MTLLARLVAATKAALDAGDVDGARSVQGQAEKLRQQIASAVVRAGATLSESAALARLQRLVNNLSFEITRLLDKK